MPFRSATSGGRTLYFTDDQVLNLDDIIQSNNQTVKVPNEMSLRAHWLAVDGVQPSIPENPEIVSKEAQKKEIVEGVNNEKSIHLMSAQCLRKY